MDDHPFLQQYIASDPTRNQTRRWRKAALDLVNWSYALEQEYWRLKEGFDHLPRESSNVDYAPKFAACEIELARLPGEISSLRQMSSGAGRAVQSKSFDGVLGVKHALSVAKWNLKDVRRIGKDVEARVEELEELRQEMELRQEIEVGKFQIVFGRLFLIDNKYTVVEKAWEDLPLSVRDGNEPSLESRLLCIAAFESPCSILPPFEREREAITTTMREAAARSAEISLQGPETRPTAHDLLESAGRQCNSISEYLRRLEAAMEEYHAVYLNPRTEKVQVSAYYSSFFTSRQPTEPETKSSISATAFQAVDDISTSRISQEPSVEMRTRDHSTSRARPPKPREDLRVRLLRRQANNAVDKSEMTRTDSGFG